VSRQQSGKELGAVSAQKSYFVSDWDSSLINEQEDHHRISDLTPFHPKLGRFWVFSLLLLCGPWKNCKSWCVGFGLCDPSKGDYFLSLSCLVSIIRFGTLLREGRKKLAIVSIFGSWATSLETGLCTASAYFVRELGPFFPLILDSLGSSRFVGRMFEYSHTKILGRHLCVFTEMWKKGTSSAVISSTVLFLN
jgi:hypothetical protein